VSRRVEFLEPPGGIDAEMLRDVILLAGGPAVPPERLARWTDLERLLAYDWAAREHLHASDNRTRRRPRPSFLGEP
jgi:hypothetical protein